MRRIKLLAIVLSLLAVAVVLLAQTRTHAAFEAATLGPPARVACRAVYGVGDCTLDNSGVLFPSYRVNDLPRIGEEPSD